MSFPGKLLPVLGVACLLLRNLEAVGDNRPLAALAGSLLFFGDPLLFVEAEPRGSNTVWRYCAAIFFVGYAATVMTELPHTRDHLTLWLNTFFGISMVVSAHTRWTHAAAFIGTHTLALSYLLLLWFLGDGHGPETLVDGFYKIDVAQYNGDVVGAAVHTFILHFWPLMIAYAELDRFKSELRVLYADCGGGGLGGWLSFAWMAIVSPVIIGLVYEQVQIAKHGSVEVALNVNYKIPTSVAPALVNTTKAVVLPIQLLAYKVLMGVVAVPPPPGGKKAD